MSSLIKRKKEDRNKATRFDLNEILDEAVALVKKETRPWPIEIRLLHLGEEVGELFDIFLQYKKMKNRRQSLDDVSRALNDVAVELFAIYDAFKINLAVSLKNEMDEKKNK